MKQDSLPADEADIGHRSYGRLTARRPKWAKSVQAMSAECPVRPKARVRHRCSITRRHGARCAGGNGEPREIARYRQYAPAAVIYSHTVSENSPANLQIVSSLAASAPSPQRLRIHKRASGNSEAA